MKNIKSCPVKKKKRQKKVERRRKKQSNGENPNQRGPDGETTKREQ
jgi:hypothetical protein